MLQGTCCVLLALWALAQRQEVVLLRPTARAILVGPVKMGRNAHSVAKENTKGNEVFCFSCAVHELFLPVHMSVKLHLIFRHNTGSEACTQCPSNSWAPAGSDELTDCTCTSGAWGPDQDTCNICPADKRCAPSGNTDESECFTCPECGEDHFLTTDGGCHACPEHSSSEAQETGQNLFGKTRCTCNAGYTGNNGHKCSACKVGCHCLIHPQHN